MQNPDNYQVGGDHYKKGNGQLQHWDVVVALQWDYFQGQITKYVDRHARKNGFEDLLKSHHYLTKYMAVTYPKEWEGWSSGLKTPRASLTDEEIASFVSANILSEHSASKTATLSRTDVALMLRRFEHMVRSM